MEIVFPRRNYLRAAPASPARRQTAGPAQESKAEIEFGLASYPAAFWANQNDFQLEPLGAMHVPSPRNFKEIQGRPGVSGSRVFLPCKTLLEEHFGSPFVLSTIPFISSFTDLGQVLETNPERYVEYLLE